MKISTRKSRTLLVLGCIILLCATTGATTVSYPIQTGNFDQEQKLDPGGGGVGAFNSTGSEIGIFANGNGQANESLFKTFRTTANTSGSVRPLQIGDSFSISLYSFSNPFGFAGVYFDDNTSYGSYSNYNTNERTAVVLGSSGNWMIENNGTSVDTGIGNNTSITATISITSSNSFNMTITNNSNSTSTTYYDLVMKSSPGTTSRIQSMALELQNDNNANFYVRDGSLSNTGSVTLGGSNLSLINSGLIEDGKAADNVSTTSVNAVTKIGSGTVTLTGANTYTGGTTISVGTLQIGNNDATGAVGSGSLSIASSTGTTGPTLSFNRNDTPSYSNGIVLGTSGQHSFIGVTSGNTATLTGPISGSAEFWKTDAGKLIVAPTSGSNALTQSIVIQQGTLSVASLSNAGSGGALGTGGIFIGQSGSGTLEYTGATATTDQVGAFALQGSTSNTISVTNSASTLTLSQGLSETTPANLTKEGAGSLALSGNSSYTGGTIINTGTLFANNATSSTGTGTVTVNNSGTLGGNGKITGSVTMGSGTHLSPGATGSTSVGSLTVGAVTMSGATLDININAGGANTGTGAGSVYDALLSGGGTNAISVNGAALAVSTLSSSLAIGNVYFIAQNTTANADAYGLFSDAPAGVYTDGNGDTFAVNYAAIANGDAIANDISLTVLTVVPEPSTWAMGGLVALALAGTAFRRFRRNQLLPYRITHNE